MLLKAVLRRYILFLIALLILTAAPALGTAATFTVSVKDLDGVFLAASRNPEIARDQVTLQVFEVTGGVDRLVSTQQVSTRAAVRIPVSDTLAAVRLVFRSNGLRTATVDLINTDQTIQVPMPRDMLAWPPAPICECPPPVCCEPIPCERYCKTRRFWHR